MLCPKCSKKVIYNQKKCRKCGEVILWENVSDISCVAYTPLSSSMADTPEFTAAGERGAFGTLQKNGVAGVKKRRKKLWALIGAACLFVIALGMFFVFFNSPADLQPEGEKFAFDSEVNIMADLSNYNRKNTDNLSVIQSVSGVYGFSEENADGMFDLSENEFTFHGDEDGEKSEQSEEESLLNQENPGLKVSFLKAEQMINNIPVKGSGIRILTHNGKPVYSFGRYEPEIEYSGDIETDTKPNQKLLRISDDAVKKFFEHRGDEIFDEYVISDPVRIIEKTDSGYVSSLKSNLTGWDKQGNLFSYELRYNLKTKELEEKKDFNKYSKLTEKERDFETVTVISYSIKNKNFYSYKSGKKFWEKNSGERPTVYEEEGTLKKLFSRLRPEYFENINFIIPENYECDDILTGRYTDPNELKECVSVVMENDNVDEDALLKVIIDAYILRAAGFEPDYEIREFYREHMLECFNSGEAFDEKKDGFMEEILSLSLFMLNETIDMEDIRTVVEVLAGMEKYSDSEEFLKKEIDDMFANEVETGPLFLISGRRNLDFSLEGYADDEGFMVRAYAHNEKSGMLEFAGENKINPSGKGKSKDAEKKTEYPKKGFCMFEILSADGKKEIAEPVYIFVDDTFNSSLIEIPLI